METKRNIPWLALSVSVLALVLSLFNYLDQKQVDIQNGFISLLSQLDHIESLSQLEDFQQKWTYNYDNQLESILKKDDLSKMDDDSFLKYVSDQMYAIQPKHDIPVGNTFARMSFFSGLKSYFESADGKCKKLFRYILQAQIGDENARKFTYQALAEHNKELLTIFGSFPMAFINIKGGNAPLYSQLESRFVKNGLMQRSEN